MSVETKALARAGDARGVSTGAGAGLAPERGCANPGAEPPADEGRELKVCPQCGARLFADMDVCYGCLTRVPTGDAGEARAENGTDPAPHTAPLPRPAPVEGAAFGEPDREDGQDTEIWGSLDELWGDGCASVEGEEAAQSHACASRRRACDLADPALPDPFAPDGEGDAGKTMALAPVGAAVDGVRVRVCTPGLSATCVVPKRGLSVGRDADNVVALHSMAVSRHHVRLFPCEAGVMAQDLGATNPALLNGMELVGAALLGAGDVLELRGAGATICLLEARDELDVRGW